MPLAFKPMTAEDYALAARFKRATVRDAMGSEAWFEAWFPPQRPYAEVLAAMQAADPDRCAQALLDGVVVGEVIVGISSHGWGHLINLYLLPAWRGQGLGAQMVDHALAYWRRQAVEQAFLRTNPANAKLVDFYTRQGWHPAGVDERGFLRMERLTRQGAGGERSAATGGVPPAP